jgi:hypothetical protein
VLHVADVVDHVEGHVLDDPDAAGREQDQRVLDRVGARDDLRGGQLVVLVVSSWTAPGSLKYARLLKPITSLPGLPTLAAKLLTAGRLAALAGGGVEKYGAKVAPLPASVAPAHASRSVIAVSESTEATTPAAVAPVSSMSIPTSTLASQEVPTPVSAVEPAVIETVPVLYEVVFSDPA